MAVSSIFYTAYRLAGILKRPGSGYSPSEDADALAALNSIIDEWGLQEHCAYSQLRTEFTLDSTGTKVLYTVGQTTVNNVAPDVLIPRPTYLRGAGLCFNNSTPEVETPMRVLSDQEWEALSPKLMASTVPYIVYYKAEVPNGNLYVWPISETAWNMAIYTLEGISQFSSDSESVVVPPGYLSAMNYALALRLVDMNPTLAHPSPRLEVRADAALKWVKERNFQPLLMMSEGGARGLTQQTGRYNILSNTWNSR
jgi:hypothetical protein